MGITRNHYLIIESLLENNTKESESLVSIKIKFNELIKTWLFLRVVHLGIDVWKLNIGGKCAPNAKYNCQTDSKQVLWRKIEKELWKES